MILAPIVALLLAAICWAVVFVTTYAILYGSLIFSYLFIWDNQTRSQICPKGLLHAILHDR